jgi:membrane protease YdiL (CAAX protease family)
MADFSSAHGSPAKRSRIISAIELFIGAGVVLGHNIYHIVPNEVILLTLIGLLSIKLRAQSWTVIGLRKPPSWLRILWISVSAAVLRIVLGELVVNPLTSRFWPPAAAPAGAQAITGNIKYALLALLFVWTFAAFGEEFVYRGYLLARAAELSKNSRIAYLIGIVVVSVLFGYGHYYKGPAGIIDSAVAGLILGVAYLIAGRNLWASILAHGIIDTFAVVIVYLGWTD